MSRMTTSSAHWATAILVATAVAGCGGGGGGGDPANPATEAAVNSTTAPDVAAVDAARAPTDAFVNAAGSAATAPPTSPIRAADRISAATAAANSSVNACGAIRPFYWELGDAKARQVGGSVKGAPAERLIAQNTVLPFASASKWLYAAYVVQRRAGDLAANDTRLLSMLGGFISLKDCRADQTVGQCLAWTGNGAYTASADGHFDYNGGHMQQHAALMGLGGFDPIGLATEIRSQLGADLDLTYAQALAPGGAVGSANTYAAFLRKLLSGQLRIGALLGTSAVCASPAKCKPGDALYSPAPSNEITHYSLGHWVEDDPTLGDGSFSSAGSFGFYPWVNAGRNQYGVISRKGPEGSGKASMYCGRLIRKAWQTGVAQ